MDRDREERRLTAILSADAVGYSRLMAEDELGTVRTLTAYRDEIRALAARHRGRIVDSPGDNVLAEFASAVEAVSCASAIQRSLGERNAALPPERRLEFRIGVHLGDVIVEGERIYGDGVNVAARLEGLADAGGICVSRSVHEQVERRLGLRFDDLGERALKNIPKPVHVYRVRLDGERAPPPARVSGLRGVVAAAVAVGALVLVLAIWVLRAPVPAPTASARIESLAVLPLANLSGDPAQEYFSDGMTEALIADLAKIGSLRVISRTSVMRYKNARKPLPEIARELGVDAVVEGSVLRAGDRVRITAQLLHAASDSHLWAQSYERELRDVIALQRGVAQAIASEVRAQLTPQEERLLAGARPVDPGAYEAYLRGRHLWNRRTPEAWEQAIPHFERAIALDPESALGHAGLANLYDSQGVWGVIPPREAARLIRAAVTRAIELDDGLAEAHTAFGDLHWWDWDWPGVEREYRRAIELNPGYAVAHNWLGYYLASVGRTDEALASWDRALELDPASAATFTDVARGRVFARRYDEAAALAHSALEIDPEHADAHSVLADVHGARGRTDDALRSALRAAELTDRADMEMRVLGYSYARAGRRDEALGVIAEIERRSRERFVDPIHIATIYAGLQDRESFFRWLERSYEVGSFWLTWINVHPIFDSVRDDPRFTDVLRRIGIPGVRAPDRDS